MKQFMSKHYLTRNPFYAFERGKKSHLPWSIIAVTLFYSKVKGFVFYNKHKPRHAWTQILSLNHLVFYNDVQYNAYKLYFCKTWGGKTGCTMDTGKNKSNKIMWGEVYLWNDMAFSSTLSACYGPSKILSIFNNKKCSWHMNFSSAALTYASTNEHLRE